MVSDIRHPLPIHCVSRHHRVLRHQSGKVWQQTDIQAIRRSGLDQNAARSSFECAICLEILEDPVQVRDCGHQFCALCIHEIMKTDPRCPSCRITLSDNMVFDDHAARRLIKKLDVNCCNKGCTWVGNLSSLLENHQDSCNFVIHTESNVSHPDLETLEARLESLITEVSTMKEMRGNEIKEMKAKHEKDLKEANSKLKKLMDQIAFFEEFASVPPTSEQSLRQLTLNPSVTIAFKIANFTRRLNQAKSSKRFGEVTSDPFYTSHGYKMRILVHLNEGPCGYVGYLGIYFHLMRGDNDDNLTWPFQKRCTFILVDQQDDEFQVKNHEMSLVPAGQEELNRPSFGVNLGLGFRQFILHSALPTRQYVRNHTAYIGVAIDA